MSNVRDFEQRHEYVLADNDRTTISAFEFKLSNNLWVLRDAIMWVAEAPHGRVLQENIVKLADYFSQRMQAMEAALPKLSASQNPDLQAMAEPLEEVHGQLATMVQAMRTYLETRTPEAATTLWNTARVICDQIKLSSRAIGLNPAYKAYRARQGEEQRVTIEFDLAYDEAA